jgi:chitin disaccharide deacetylase
MNETARKKIIITADDFGRSELANKKILELALSKKIDRVSVMSKGIFSQDDTFALLHSGAKLDAHLNITEKFNGLHKLNEGIAKPVVLFLIKYVGGKISAGKVRQEWESQIENFKKIFGKYPDGISSHQHVHYYPSYFKIVLELSEKFSIPFLRFGKRGFLGKITGIKHILSILRNFDIKYFRKSNLETSDYLVSLDWIKNFDRFLKKLPDGTVEITFHPERKEEFDIIDKYF